jgi:hypothetical protein
MAGARVSYEIPTSPEPLGILLACVSRLRAQGTLRAASPEPVMSAESAPFWRFDISVARDERAYQMLLDALTAIDDWCRSVWHFPPLYMSGLHYREEPHGVEIWRSLPSVYLCGGGDCDNLACARASELHAEGIPARAKLTRIGRRGSAVRYHVTTAILDNRGRTIGEEDPSALLSL